MGLLFTIITMILSLVLKNYNPPMVILFFLAFLVGFFGYGWPGLFNASVTETVGEDNVGIAIGLASLFMRSGMMLAPPIFGYIADLRGSYDFSWFLLGIIMFVASLGQYLSFSKK